MLSTRVLLIGCLACLLQAGLAEGQMLAMPASIRMEPDTRNPFVLDESRSQYAPPIEYGFGNTTSWNGQLLPNGFLYPSYLAGTRESRFACHCFGLLDGDPYWDATLGGRVGLFRYGTDDPFWPEGWQLGIEGAAFPRLTLDDQRDLVAADFRVGVPLSLRRGVWETKFGYYHFSSHLGDEWLLVQPDIQRINYVRESIVFGLGVRPYQDVRLYAEVGWAFYVDGGAQPLEFQFGVEYSPTMPTSPRGAPFIAIHAHLRQEADFGGNLTFQTGWQWRSRQNGLLRVGVHYLNGSSTQFEFPDDHEQQIGGGIWYDF